MDIGWNAVIKNDVPEAIPSNQDSTHEIYPRFAAYNITLNYDGYKTTLIPLTSNNRLFLKNFEAIQGQDTDDDYSGYGIFQDSFFSSTYWPVYPDNWKDGSSILCSLRDYGEWYQNGHHNDKCGERWVLLGMRTNSPFIFPNNEFLGYVFFLLSYRNITDKNQYENIIKNLFTSGSYDFPVMYIKLYEDNKNSTHDSYIPYSNNINITVTPSNPTKPFRNREEFALNTFGYIYEDYVSGKYLYSNIIWKNKKYGWFYPSDDKSLYSFSYNIFELNFINGDSIFSGNKLRLYYYQKYAYCYHSLYNPQWKNGKYEYLVNKNDITNPEYCTKIN